MVDVVTLSHSSSLRFGFITFLVGNISSKFTGIELMVISVLKLNFECVVSQMTVHSFIYKHSFFQLHQSAIHFIFVYSILSLCSKKITTEKVARFTFLLAGARQYVLILYWSLTVSLTVFFTDNKYSALTIP